MSTNSIRSGFQEGQPEADRDLEAIWLYTFEQWGLEQAHRYTDELTEAFA